jgi:aminomethyltransferase
MATQSADLLRTPLFSRHQELGAKCADFGGWEMPIEYSGAVAEHGAVRSRVGIFDVSHMGKLRITGPGAISALNSVVASDLAKIGNGQAQYSMLCNEQGGVVDDFIIYRFTEDNVFIIPNATNATEVFQVLRDSLPSGITIENLHNEYGIIAIQGPLAGNVVGRMGLPLDCDYMNWLQADVDGETVIICRTGYTGEIGFELVAPVGVLQQLWDRAITCAAEVDGIPAGLGARDILRTEMGYPLHGQDISPTISPLEAKISWAVGWDKPEFAGRANLQAARAQGAARKRVALKAIGRGIPRAHMDVYSEQELVNKIGEITSGTFSPTLKEGIALALVDSEHDKDESMFIDVRGKALECANVSLPFIVASPK